MRIFACGGTVLIWLATGCGGDDGGSSDGAVPSTGMATAVATTTDGDTAEPSTGGGPTTGATTAMTTTTDDDGSTTSQADDGTDSSSGSTTAGDGPGEWLLTIDNGRNPPALLQLGLAGGTTELCELASTVDYRSLVFGRDGTLYGFNAAAQRLDSINPCNCSFQIIGETTVSGLSLAVGAPGTDSLLAVASDLNAVAEVDVESGLAATIGPLTFPFVGVGVTWSQSLGGLYAIEGSNDYVYSIDPRTGQDTDLVPLLADFTNPGLVQHDVDSQYYACDGDTLYTFQPGAGQVDAIASIGMTGPCETLAAPTTAIECLD